MTTNKTVKNRIIALITITILALGLGVGLLYKYVPLCLKKQPTTQVEFKAYWVEQLAQMEKEVWQELNKIGLYKEDLLELKKRDYQIYLDMHPRYSKKPLDANTGALVDKILIQFNLDRSQVPCFEWDSYLAATTDYGIYINPEQLKFYKKEAQEFIIAHELQHFINQDHSMRFFIKSSIPEQQTTPADQPLDLDINHPYFQYVRFTEKRADIMAAIASPQLAQAYTKFSENLFKMQGGNGQQDPGDTHPKTTERLAFAHNITEMQKTLVS